MRPTLKAKVASVVPVSETPHRWASNRRHTSIKITRPRVLAFDMNPEGTSRQISQPVIE